MNETDFAFWTKVLKQNFPDHPKLGDLHKGWYPAQRTGGLRNLLSGILRKFIARLAKHRHFTNNLVVSVTA
jgi:hypothetical protein